MKLRKPILIGGIGLSLALWVLQSLQSAMAETVGDVALLGLVLAGATTWWWQQKPRREQSGASPSVPLDREQVQRAIALTQATIERSQAEWQQATGNPSVTEAELAELRTQAAQLSASPEQRGLTLGVTGIKGSGKTTLLAWLQEQEDGSDMRFAECAVGLVAATSDRDLDCEMETKTWEQLLQVDALLFLAEGDVTEPEYQLLQRLSDARQRVLLVWNKQDRFNAQDRATVFDRLQERVAALAMVDLVAIAAAPDPIKVRQHQPDGSVKEWLERPEPEMAALKQALARLSREEAPQLLLAQVFRQAMLVRQRAQDCLNRLRRDRALPIVEQAQWIAAATAFANPVAALDLLSTGAVAAQMVVDLGVVYQQSFSLDGAREAIAQLSQLCLKLGVVELSTKTASDVLKAHAATYVAGGLLQGASAAYLTRLVGLSFLEYLAEQDERLEGNAPQGLQVDRLKQKLQEVFERNRRSAFLQSFLQQAVNRLRMVPAAVE